MAIKYYIILTSYSNDQYEFIGNKAVLCSDSCCATSAVSHQKEWWWSVKSHAFEDGLRPVYEHNYCLQLATLPAESLFSPVFPFQCLIYCAPWQFLCFQELSAFTITSASHGVGLRYTPEFLPLCWAAFPPLWIATQVFSEFWWNSSSGPALCSCGCDAW